MSKCDIPKNFEVVVDHMVNLIVNHIVDDIVDHVEETHTESHKKISVDSVNGSHRNSTLKLFLSC